MTVWFLVLFLACASCPHGVTTEIATVRATERACARAIDFVEKEFVAAWCTSVKLPEKP